MGSQNAHSVISVSNEGRLCVWNLGMLNTPQKAIDLQANKDNIASHCIGFTEGETNNFFIGGEDGKVYEAQIHTKFIYRVTI